MNEAKHRGDYVDDQEEKRKARHEQKKKPTSSNKSRNEGHRTVEGEEELDSELRQISDEGRRVGWAYRYRVRRKLDELKRQQAGKCQLDHSIAETNTSLSFQLASNRKIL